MAVDLSVMGVSSITSWLAKFVINPLLWLIIIVGFVLGVFLILYLRKKRKLAFPVIEMVDHGSGKFAINVLKGGYFGKTLYLKGLWWKGEEVFRVSSGEIILDLSTEDYQEINGKRGVVCFRDPINQDILVPITRCQFKNKELLAEIANASYRDAAVDIFKESVKETSEWKEKLIQFGMWAAVIIFSLVAIIVIIQMIKNGQSKAAELMLQAGDKGLEACRQICREAVSVAVNAP